MLTPRWVEQAASSEPRHGSVSKAATLQEDDVARTPKLAEDKPKSAGPK